MGSYESRHVLIFLAIDIIKENVSLLGTPIVE